MSFNQISEVLSHYFLNFFSLTFLFLPFLDTGDMYVRSFFIVPETQFNYFSIFFLGCSDQICIDLSSKFTNSFLCHFQQLNYFSILFSWLFRLDQYSLILSSAIFNLPLSESSEFFMSVNCIFQF